MEALKDLFSGAHGLLAVLLILAASTMVLAGHMTTQEWTTFAQWIMGIFTGGHAVMAAADSLGSKKKEGQP